jgi:2-dehydro-3-deoxyglucarate aldolase/4-hydroxy-2-oxoheptanedioate aldolase
MRILGAAGFHWTFIDGEHGTFDLQTIQDMCQASVGAGITPVVRVADLQYSLIARALDAGAQGILFPRVEDPETLRRAVSWTRFPPVGVRGYGLTPVNYNYEPRKIPEVIEHMNAQTMVIFQVETVAALERLDELMSVPGVDCVMVGPADLSISLGVPGDFVHPKMVEAIEQVRDACLRHGLIPGIHNRSTELAQFWKERGMKFIGCSNDTAMLFDRASEIIKKLA